MLSQILDITQAQATNKRDADLGECFFYGSQVEWLSVKKKAESESNRLFLIFLVLPLHNLAQMCTAHLP